MIVVLDASAAVRSAMDAESPFRNILAEADLVIAPELIVAEICSALRKYVRARLVSRVQAEEFVQRAIALIDEIQPMRDLASDVLALAATTESSVYDLFYIALAKRTGATLVTADIPLRQCAAKMGIDSPG